MRVASVCRAARRANVYDLTVEGAHEFFANGVLVSNSMDAIRYAVFGRFGRAQVIRSTWRGQDARIA